MEHNASQFSQKMTKVGEGLLTPNICEEMEIALTKEKI